MPGAFAPTSPLDLVAHVIQVALAPVFLLSGIATLLNVFSTRLARVADRVEQVTRALDGADEGDAAALATQMRELHRRAVALDAAVVLAAIGGAATCASVLVLFLGAFSDSMVASVSFGTFGLALVCTLGAICAYTIEMLMAGSGVRAEAAANRRPA
jgi:Protein of unknown function (DUF2721)